MKLVILIFALLGAVVVAGCIYCRATYIDDIVEEGSAHGFTIGASKNEALVAARSEFSEGDVWIRDPEEKGPTRRLSLNSTADAEMLSDRSQWRLFFDDNPFDSLTLDFESDRLVRIYRHRNRCELP